mgnify:CR=1 FL=1
MSKKQDMINDLTAHADAGTGVDYDGMYGYQCADVTCYGIYEYFGTRLWGNAIDLLRSAEAAGLQVVYGAQHPKAGWFFVKNFVAGDGVNYGHTGLVYKDSEGSTIKTIEQNIDGNADSLYVGGPARYNTRNFDGIVGWFYFPLDKADYQPVQATTTGDGTITEENGTFTVEVSALNVRDKAGLDGAIVAVYGAGESINYDGYCDKDVYIWITYIGGSGNRRYVAVGQSENGQRVTDFGSFA